MNKVISFTMFLLLSVYLAGFCLTPAIAQDSDDDAEVPGCRTSDNTTSTIDILDSCDVDLPKAKLLECVSRGSIGKLVPKITQLDTAGNVFFVDQNVQHRNIGIFERASVINQDRKLYVEILIRYPGGITGEEIEDLLVKRKVVTTNGAEIIFVVKELIDGVLTTYLYDGKDATGNPLISTVWTKISRLGNITHEGTKFITANGIVKILFPQPPKLVDSLGNLVDAFENEPGILVCKCKDCPIHSFDLRKLEAAFGGDLVGDIINETSRDGDEVEAEL